MIEGNSKWNEGVLLELARSLSENVQVLTSEQRKISHIAAVFACNFTNHFYALSEEILEKNGMEGKSGSTKVRGCSDANFTVKQALHTR